MLRAKVEELVLDSVLILEKDMVSDMANKLNSNKDNKSLGVVQSTVRLIKNNLDMPILSTN